jgi:hypothetical protein
LTAGRGAHHRDATSFGPLALEIDDGALVSEVFATYGLQRERNQGRCLVLASDLSETKPLIFGDLRRRWCGECRLTVSEFSGNTRANARVLSAATRG